VPGGSYFFTVVVNHRKPLFSDARAIALLGKKMRECFAEWPVTVNALVLLPDHLHAIWALPPGDAEYSKRWGWIKKEFTKAWLAESGCESPITSSQKRERRLGVWQPRFWEHTLEDEVDFERHLDYIHWNPVKHGHVRYPHQWPHSTFHRYVDRGVYDRNWGCYTEPPPPAFQFADICHTTGE
jgi:putative transposase